MLKYFDSNILRSKYFFQHCYVVFLNVADSDRCGPYILHYIIISLHKAVKWKHELNFFDLYFHVKQILVLKT